MLVCPHCQFQNPDSNKFCQNCGGSLTEKECPGCSASVSFDAEQCSQCGTVTGTTWRCLVSRSTITPPSVTAQLSLPLAAQQFLDSQQRYRLMEPLPALSDTLLEAEVKVLDCQPFRLSAIDILSNQFLESEPIAPDDEAMLRNSIPPIARPYLELREHHPSLLVPKLHDAWEANGLNVLVLDERANLPLLVDRWGSAEVQPLQVLDWLHQMVAFWSALQPLQCCQSLLELRNLRLDEDEVLCLQRLYSDPPEQTPKLQSLGRVWRRLFQESQRTQTADLAKLCRDLAVGELTSLDDLECRIEAIATATQLDLVPSKSIAEVPAHPPIASTPQTNGIIPPPPLPPLLTMLPTVDLDTSDDDDFSDEDLTTPTYPEWSETSDDTGGDSTDSPTMALPMQLVGLEDAGMTDVGRQRNHNEDCFSISSQTKKQEGVQGRNVQAKGLYILCDGMGGHAGGEVASALAVETLRQYFETHWQDRLPGEEVVRQGIYAANDAIYRLNQQNARSGSGRMGTTLAVVLIQNTEAVIAHVGDSRLYRFTLRGGLEQLTVDHEVGQREIQRGVEPDIAYGRPDAYQLTQALGPRDKQGINPDIRYITISEDTLFLLCSDGLTDNNLLEIHWHNYLKPLLENPTSVEQGVQQLIQLANQHNGHDNITAIVIRARVQPMLVPQMMSSIATNATNIE